MKTWAVKVVHLLEWVRNFNRHKRLILAFFISIVLIISIIYMRDFPPIAHSGSDGSSGSFEIYLGSATMKNLEIEGPYTYSASNVTLNVTKVTADVANMSEMLLIKEGSRLELEAPSAFATKLVVYTTYLESRVDFDNWVRIKLYGNDTWPYPPIEEMFMTDAYMKVVYLEAESFSALGLSLTCT